MRFYRSPAGRAWASPMPGTGTPSGPPQAAEHLENGSEGVGGISPWAFPSPSPSKNPFTSASRRHGVLVPEIDQGAAERLLEQKVGSQGSRPERLSGAGGPQDEAHGARQLVDKARGRCARGAAKGEMKQHLHRTQLHRGGRSFRLRGIRLTVRLIRSRAFDVHHSGCRGRCCSAQ